MIAAFKAGKEIKRKVPEEDRERKPDGGEKQEGTESERNSARDGPRQKKGLGFQDEGQKHVGKAEEKGPGQEDDDQ